MAFEFEAIGTAWQIETSGPLSRSLRRSILRCVERFDATYSRFRGDSLVTALAEAEHGMSLCFPPDALPLFEIYDQLHIGTAGAVDPLVGRALECLGYGRDYSLRPDPMAMASHLASGIDWARDVQRSGCMLTTARPVTIDVGAAGKGYLVDLVAALLDDARVSAYTIDAGGDLRHRGARPLRVGLEDPLMAGRVIGVAEILDQALCASATNRRAWGEGLHHVLDARSGLPTRDVVATWAVAAEARVADAMATALFFMPPGQPLGDLRYEGMRLFGDGHAEVSPAFPAEVFITKGVSA